MRLSIKSKHLYLLALVVICLLGIVIMPTYAKFGDEVTFDDVVGINLNYNIGISNIEQFEEVVLEAGESTSFNVNVTNSSGSKVYYGIWYKMVSPDKMPNDDSIKIGKLEGTNISTSGGIEDGDNITSTIGLINDTNEEIKLYIGVASSSTSTNDIEYINGKYLISGEVNVPQNFATYIKNLYNSGNATSVHIGGDTSKPQVSLDSTSGIMLDNNGEYRYYGATPNNYVEFNGELWRIISVSTVKSSEEDTEGESRVRIIRNESIGKHYWDTDSDGDGTDTANNNWETSTLNTTLNGIYYNSTSGTCYGSNTTCDYANGDIKGLSVTARSMIGDAVWYLGRGDGSKLYADDFYNFERDTTVYEGNPTSTVAKLGIMYPSDYAYAVDLSLCKKTAGHKYDSSTSSYVDYRSDVNCTGTDWLFNSGYQWLISSYSRDLNYVFNVRNEGYVTYSSSVNVNAYQVRPVAVLKSDVVITGGSGTDGEPYKLASRSDNDSGSNNSVLSQYIIDLYNTGELSDYQEVHIADNSDKQLVTLNTKQRIMKVDQGPDYGVEYRYYGNDLVEDTANGKYLTKNYVDFNGELWRIISVSKVFSSESDTTGETRVRIIKDIKIGNLSWDNDDYTNNWADATLMCQLNTLYYNDTVPACTGKSLTSLTTSLNAEARNLIDNALWYLGGGDTTDLYADDYYTMERGTAVADSSYPTRWTGKLGIMYPSDYAYAADLSVCKVTGYYYKTANCFNTDWLFNGDYQWLMSPYSDDRGGAWYVCGTGFVHNNFDFLVADKVGVRPLAVLKSDVVITGGKGTSGDPYKIALIE